MEYVQLCNGSVFSQNLPSLGFECRGHCDLRSRAARRIGTARRRARRRACHGEEHRGDGEQASDG